MMGKNAYAHAYAKKSIPDRSVRLNLIVTVYI